MSSGSASGPEGEGTKAEEKPTKAEDDTNKADEKSSEAEDQTSKFQETTLTTILAESFAAREEERPSQAWKAMMPAAAEVNQTAQQVVADFKKLLTQLGGDRWHYLSTRNAVFAALPCAVQYYTFGPQLI